MKDERWQHPGSQSDRDGIDIFMRRRLLLNLANVLQCFHDPLRQIEAVIGVL
jgi:hypothetical protein